MGIGRWVGVTSLLGASALVPTWVARATADGTTSGTRLEGAHAPALSAVGTLSAVATAVAHTTADEVAASTVMKAPPGEPANGAARAALQIPPERVAELRTRALSETLERALLRAAVANAPSSEAVNDYYSRFRDRYTAPDAVEVWRILVDSEEKAKTLLAQIKASPTPQKTWSMAAREHSADKATHFRKGHLGFVRADGSTDVPQVRVSPSIFAAASLLKDGAFSEAPFREGEHWALVWRRGFRKARVTTLDQARPEIVQQLSLAAARTTLTDLLASLRVQHLTDYHPELVESLPEAQDPGMNVQRAPRQAHPADGKPTPRKTDWGER